MLPRREQVAAAKAAVLNHRGVISAATGSGKSLIAALIINELQVRTLIVVPSLELKKQLTACMAQWFGSAKVGKNKDIYIENVQALSDKTPLAYDCLIIDEFHHSGSASYRKLNKFAWAHIYYRFGLTATPWRTDTEEKLLLESILSEIVYTLDYKTAVKNGFICSVEAYYIEIPKQNNEYYTWQEVYKELIVNNCRRNEILHTLLHSLAEQDKSTLCLIKEIAHGNNINYPYFVHGASEDRRLIADFNAGKVRSLVATEGVCGEGLDCRPCEYVILAGLGKAKSRIMQMVGRAVRKYPGKETAKVIIFRDSSHKFTLRHYNEQKKILKDEYNVVPLKLEIT